VSSNRARVTRHEPPGPHRRARPCAGGRVAPPAHQYIRRNPHDFSKEASVESLKKKRRRLVLPALAVGVALAISGLMTAGASSHREAPLISEDPVADNTDTYAFVSTEKRASVSSLGRWVRV